LLEDLGNVQRGTPSLPAIRTHVAEKLLRNFLMPGEESAGGSAKARATEASQARDDDVAECGGPWLRWISA
jgi:hypothetical protein